MPAAIHPQKHDPWRRGEPALRDVLADPLVHLVMARDRLSPDQVRDWLARIRPRTSETSA